MYPAHQGHPFLIIFTISMAAKQPPSECDLCNRIACPDQKPRYTSSEKKPTAKKHLWDFCDTAQVRSMQRDTTSRAVFCFFFFNQSPVKTLKGEHWRSTLVQVHYF